MHADVTLARDVKIAALSPRDELISVVRAAMAITAAVWLYLANNPFPDSPGGAIQRSLLPYQAVASSLPPAGQRMFRELQVGLLEAETLRSTEGKWPEAQRLASDGVEPFAPNPTAKGSAYEWRMLRNGFFVNYLGVPKEAGSAAWLLVIQEPDPRGPPDVFQDDQEHHRLIDGTILHVSLWNHPDGSSVSMKPIQLPQTEGWIQLYAADPSAR